ncbi:MAG: hypothetical protein LBI63_01775 [Candidatus Ancillula sp.]|nr:hypothetical protein [Candidatus Ancillula sp.]
MKLELEIDVEEMIREYLDSKLSTLFGGVKVYSSSTPNDLPITYVKIVKTGGLGVENKVFNEVNLTFDISSCASQNKVTNINTYTNALLRNAYEDLPIYEINQISTPYWAPDTKNDKYYRLITTFTVKLRTKTLETERKTI